MAEYIDREGLIKFLDSLQYPKFPITKNGFKFISIIDAIKVVSERQTEDVKPIVHAHWIKGIPADITCSNCDFPLYVDDKTIQKLAYCPHCGAKMDE
jgi:hypothetical protein